MAKDSHKIIGYSPLSLFRTADLSLHNPASITDTISPQLSNGNAIAQTLQRRDNLSAGAKMVKHLRTEIFGEEFEYCGANS